MGEKLLSPQDNQLDVYNLATGEVTLLIKAGVNDVNGQVCLHPDGSGNFFLGDDTRQPDERAGWGLFSPDGTMLSKIPEPENPGEAKQPEPYGCAVDAERRLFVSDVGSGSFGPEDGKLIMFFPPDYQTSCFLDTSLKIASSITIDEAGNVYVAESTPPGRVYRFSPPFPSSPDDADRVPVNKSIFIEDTDLKTPMGIVRAPNGNWYVSSVFVPPLINEYDRDGKFVRNILPKGAGGNPAGIALDSKGTLYYADLGLGPRPDSDMIGPVRGKGTVRKITFDGDGNPAPPEVLGDGLTFPDSVSVLPSL